MAHNDRMDVVAALKLYEEACDTIHRDQIGALTLPKHG